MFSKSKSNSDASDRNHSGVGFLRFVIPMMKISTADLFLYISLSNGKGAFLCGRLAITISHPHPEITALVLSESYAVSAITKSGAR